MDVEDFHDDDETSFVLTDEWAEFFAKSAAKRRESTVFLLNTLFGQYVPLSRFFTYSVVQRNVSSKGKRRPLAKLPKKFRRLRRTGSFRNMSRPSVEIRAVKWECHQSKRTTQEVYIWGVRGCTPPFTSEGTYPDK